MANLSVNISGFSAIVAEDVTTTDDLIVGDDADVVGDLTAGTIASDATVQGTRLLATANGTSTDPFVEGPNNTGIYVLSGSSSALAQGGGAWMTFGTGGISVLNQNFSIVHGLAQLGNLTPAEITSNQTNYNPFSSNMHLYQNVKLTSDAARVINSMQSPAFQNQVMYLWNINTDTARTITLLHDDGATGTAGTRFLCPNNANYVIRANGGVKVWYDSTTGRWRVLAA